MARTGISAQKIAQRRQAILEAGFRLFSERSIDAVSMQNIADEAGTSFATMYRYFNTKLSLVVTISAWKWGEYIDKSSEDDVIDMVQTGQLTALEAFEIYLERFVNLYRNHRDLLRFNQFFNVYLCHEPHEPGQLKPYTDTIKSIENRFHIIYEKAGADGTLRTDVAEQEMFASTLHIMMAAVTRYAVGLVYRADGISDEERELSQLKEMLIREYRRVPESAM